MNAILWSCNYLQFCCSFSVTNVLKSFILFGFYSLMRRLAVQAMVPYVDRHINWCFINFKLPYLSFICLKVFLLPMFHGTAPKVQGSNLLQLAPRVSSSSPFGPDPAFMRHFWSQLANFLFPFGISFFQYKLFFFLNWQREISILSGGTVLRHQWYLWLLLPHSLHL